MPVVWNKATILNSGMFITINFLHDFVPFFQLDDIYCLFGNNSDHWCTVQILVPYAYRRHTQPTGTLVTSQPPFLSPHFTSPLFPLFPSIPPHFGSTYRLLVPIWPLPLTSFYWFYLLWPDAGSPSKTSNISLHPQMLLNLLSCSISSSSLLDIK